MIDTERQVLLLSLKTLSEAFDRFVGACMLDGEPTIPLKSDLMKARAYLPPYCKNAFGKKNDG